MLDPNVGEIKRKLTQCSYITACFCYQTFHAAPGKRVFDLFVEGTFFRNFDLFVVGGGKGNAFVITVAKLVDDGIVHIEGINKINTAKISGIEVVLKSVHTAHAVTGGPVSTFFCFGNDCLEWYSNASLLCAPAPVCCCRQ